MAEGLESDSADFLFNTRSSVNNAVAEGAFDIVTNVFEIDEATKGNRAVQITGSMMEENKYQGNLVIVCDTVAFNKFQAQSNQGQGNYENLTFQFAGKTFVHSIELNALAIGLGYTQGFWIGYQMGMAAALPWIPIQNRMGHSDTEGDYASIINPVDGLPYAVHTYKERINGVPLNSETQDVKTEWEVSIDVAYDVAPSSVAGSSPLLAGALI